VKKGTKRHWNAQVAPDKKTTMMRESKKQQQNLMWGETIRETRKTTTLEGSRNA
jgi:hypothetical protein